MGNSIKQKTVKGVMWSSVERFSVQFVQLIIQIFIARILTPSDFGVVGMLTIFIAIAQTFVDSGFSNALIRRENRTEADNNTVFYFNLVVGLVCYLILFILAPFVAEFYEQPVLKGLMRVVSLSVIFSSFSIVQVATLTINVDFKKQAIASLVSITMSGCIGISLALKGLGPWALAIQTTSNSFINALTLWLVVRWRPKLDFSWKSFREMFSFGSRLLLSGLLDTIYKNLYTLIIGKFYKASELGYYSKANAFAQLPAVNLTRVLQRVTYPIMCQIRDDEERYKKVFETYLQMTVFVVFPICLGLASIARPLVLLLLTEKWLPCVILLQLLCINYMWHAIQAINLNILQVKGRSDIFLNLEVAKKIIGVAVLIFTVNFGIKIMCVGLIISNIIGTVLDIIYSGSILKVSLWREMKLICPALFCSMAMTLAGLYISITSLKPIIQLLSTVALCLVIYFILSYFFQRKQIYSIIELVKKK